MVGCDVRCICRESDSIANACVGRRLCRSDELYWLCMCRESDSVGGLSPMHRVSSVASVTTAAWASARSSSEANNQTLPEAPSHGAHAAPLSPLRVTSKGVMGTEAMDTNDAEVRESHVRTW